MGRKNGFDRPYTNDQILSWIAEPAAAAMFYLIVVPFTTGNTQVGLLVVYSALLASHIVCWLYCSLTDPASEGGCTWPCMAESQKESRYCAVCKKNVPGLDHHCTWLNTCIGKRQYPAFFGLVTIGTFMYWFQAVIFILLLTVWFTPEIEAKAENILGSTTTYYALVSVATVFAIGLALCLSVLFAFHMFLQFVGLGTYAWMLEGRNKSRELKDRKKQTNKQQNAATTQTNDTNNGNTCGRSNDYVSTDKTMVSTV